MDNGKPVATPEQIAAIENFRKARGRDWKARLNAMWADGRDAELFDGSLLRQVRNNLGPRWLAAYRPAPENAEPATPPSRSKDDYHGLDVGTVLDWGGRRYVITRAVVNDGSLHTIYSGAPLTRDGRIMERRNPSGFDNYSLADGTVRVLGKMPESGVFGRDRAPQSGPSR